MERFKMPAGKLATVFFSREVAAPQQKSDVESQQSSSSGGEKAEEYDETEDAPSPLPQHQHAEIVRTERTFSWKELSIDVKTADGTKRLLDNVSGQQHVRTTKE